jgi:holliday junction DNA helicase RuvA
MIGSLRGSVLDITATNAHACEIVLEVGGVGYRVAVPSGALTQLSPPGSSAFLHVHTHVRDDAIVLYGFLSRDERNCFETLIGAHGVGPAVAMALLSVHTPTALRRAVQSDDTDALILVPGIGKKTATRLLVELKSKLDDDGEDVDLTVVAAQGAGSDSSAAGRSAATRAEVRGALASLGYGADEIRQALARLPAEGGVEEQIRLALRELAAAS